MPVATLDNVSLAYGHVALLDRVALSLDAGESKYLADGMSRSLRAKLSDGRQSSVNSKQGRPLAKWQRSRERLPEHHTQRIDVSPKIHGGGAQMLGCGVR